MDPRSKTDGSLPAESSTEVICGHCLSKSSLWRCIECKTSYCNDCFSVAHEKKIPVVAKRHLASRVPVQTYNNFQKLLSGDDLQLNEARFHSLRNRLLCAVDPISLRVSKGAFLSDLFRGPKATDSISLISFLGRTGSGKSLLLSSLLPEGSSVRPIISKPAQPNSTSHDIYVFPGECQSQEYYPYYLDCEGSDGTQHVQTLRLPDEEMIHPEFFSVRSQVIQTTYPRLLYLFSHVICYVFDGALAQGQSIMDQILSFAKSSAHASSNILSAPHLIIILNKLQHQSCAKTHSEALERFCESNPEKFLLVQKLFSSVTVLHIPDGSWPDSFGPYLMKIRELQSMIDQFSRSSAPKSLQNKGQILDLLDLALNLLADQRDASFNLHELQLRTHPPPSNLFEHLVSYFQLNLRYYGKSMSHAESYDHARQALLSRILDVYLLHFARAGEKSWRALAMGEDDSRIFPLFQEILQKCEKYIDDCCPCGGTIQIGNLALQCASVKSLHNKLHQCEMASFNGEPYRWDGEFTPAGARTIPSLSTSLEHSIRALKRPDRQDYLSKLRFICLQTLAVKVSSLETCLGCLLDVPTEGLSCGHSLCTSCCEECTDSTCILCGQKSGWKPYSLPTNCGFRILSLDGGGIRGVVELIVLKQLENLLHNVPIVNFFDLIGGTSTGGIITLALGARGLSVDEGIEMYRNLGSRAFVPRTGATIPIIGQLIQYFWYRHKYHRENLHRELLNVLGTSRLFRSTQPKLFVTSCFMYKGETTACLFTSYNNNRSSQNVSDRENLTSSQRSTMRYILDASLTDAAEATSAASTFFSPFVLNGVSYIDGGLLNNNPAALCLDEAFKLFGVSSAMCDVFVSLGTGFFRDEKRELDDRILAVIRMTTDISTGTQKGWEDVLTRLSDSPLHASAGAFRINPRFDAEISLDDVASLSLAEEATRRYLESEEGLLLTHRTALRLLASSFYFNPLAISEDAKSSIHCLVQGQIISRIALPHSLIERITLQQPFEILVDGATLNAIFGTPTFESRGDRFDSVILAVEFGCLKHHRKISISLKPTALSSLLGSKFGITSAPISGFPRDKF